MPGAGTGLFSYTASGGLINGGSGSAGIAMSIAGSGGLVMGGAVSISSLSCSYSSSSGGIVAGGSGSAQAGSAYTPDGGGLVTAGSQSASLGFAVTGSGRLSTIGQAPSTLGYTVTGSGGVIAGGSVTAGIGFPYNTTGGGLLTGSVAGVSAAYGISVVAGSGLLLRGTAGTNRPGPSYLSIGAVQPGSSAGVSAGFLSMGAVQAAIFGSTASGRLTTGGTSSILFAGINTASGSLLGAGSAGKAATFTYSAAGGLVAGGSAGPQGSYGWIGSGGLATAGVTRPVQGFQPITGGGSLVIGGTTTLQPAFRFNTTGTLTAGGSASQTFTDLSPSFLVWQGPADGSPIDYTTAPTATLKALTWTSATMPTSSSTRFAVRVFDPATGYDDGNIDATVTVTLDSLGNDISGLPPAPVALSAVAGPAGALSVNWCLLLPPGAPAMPIAFLVWISTGPAVDYASTPAATVPYVPGQTLYQVTLSGLINGANYRVGVRSVNDAGTEMNTNMAGVQVGTNGPSPVTTLLGASI